MCCECGGGELVVQEEVVEDDVCADSDEGSRDFNGNTCEWYALNLGGCGMYDNDSFKSMDMCCACAPQEEVVEEKPMTEEEMAKAEEAAMMEGLGAMVRFMVYMSIFGLVVLGCVCCCKTQCCPNYECCKKKSGAA